jgi:hypothetical protein
MDEINFKKEFEDLKAKKENTSMRQHQHRKDYSTLKEKLFKQLLKEGFCARKTFYLNTEKHTLKYSSSSKNIDSRATSLLRIEETAFSRPYIMGKIKLEENKYNATVKIYKNSIIIDYPYDIKETDFKFLLRVLGVRSVYYSAFDFKRLESHYNFAKMALDVFKKDKIRVYK